MIFGMVLIIVGWRGACPKVSPSLYFLAGLAVSVFLAVSRSRSDLLDPVSPSLNRITRMARRTFWPHLKKEPILDADDLERAVDLTNLEKHVARHERQVLHNILDSLRDPGGRGDEAARLLRRDGASFFAGRRRPRGAARRLCRPSGAGHGRTE